jgi:hypothetical protein
LQVSFIFLFFFFSIYPILFIGGNDNCVRIWDIKTAKLLRTLGPFTQPVYSIAYGETWHSHTGASTSAEEANDAGAEGANDAGARAGIHEYRPGIWIAPEKTLEFFSMGLYN